MIGTDIVDIAEAKKTFNWKRPRFLEKLFTINEQQFIHDSENKLVMVCHLWSMKEAAYKLYTQIHPSRFYNPKQFQCERHKHHFKVIYKDFNCFVNTKITSQYIVSEACLTRCEISSKCFKLPCSSYKNQSQTTKEALLVSVSKRFKILKSELNIKKSEFGVPSIFHNSKKLSVKISISHHGHYGSYAISLL